MNVIAGGIAGNGGGACFTSDNNGGAGGGFLTDGGSPNTGGSNNNGFGGLSFLNGGIGGAPGRMDGACFVDPFGGFGGGGSGTCNTVGGGGGGGYSGGAGGQHYGNCGGGSIRAGGGGGGSYSIGTNMTELAGTNIGDGSVIITVLCTPTTMTIDVATLLDVNDECFSDPVPPTATNDCGAQINGVPDVTMPIITPGSTLVTWTYDDGQGNVLTQTQTIILTDATAPVADSVSLPDLSDMCDVSSVTAPTATDNCMGTITGTTTTTFPVSTPGASVIIWSFDDGSGNISTQTQNILNGAIDNGAQLVGSQLNATALVAAYQWLECEANYAIIPGEVNQFYDATSTGLYAVEITQGGCVDTSDCILVNFAAIEEIDIENLTIYPNPTQGNFTVSTLGRIESIQIVDVLGRAISLPINLADRTVNGAELKNGNYFVIVTTEKGTFTREIVIIN
ncbi:MAG: T9SS type A sorting domain-containing protein [Crocinitomicaceae bacterium]|nr:T9SS type A sorting domain-containing protein [Crocinitomicaceae bacterium]